MPFKDIAFLASQYLLPHHIVSRLAGVIAESELPAIKYPMMRFFLNRFGINLSEAERSDLKQYENFNDFFTRALAPNARPIDSDPEVWVSPVDGEVSQFGKLENGQLIQAKGKHFCLIDLLGNDQTATEHYQSGDFMTLYLSPKDYHRIHMPTDAQLIKTTFIPGRLFSVNQLTARHVSNLFARNERLVCEFSSAKGRFIMVLVGAMVVASIETTWAGVVAPAQRQIQQQLFTGQPIHFNRGEEMGRFRLGSTVILIHEPGQVAWTDSIQVQAKVQMGQTIATSP